MKWLREWGGAVITLMVVLIGSGFGLNAMQPNSGQVRFQSDVITVNAQAVVGYADASVIETWGVDVEFVKGEADVTITVGTTKCFEVDGFGTACEAGVTDKTVNDKRWMTACEITLNSKSKGTYAQKTSVLAHEFGHCLMQKHNDTEDSIMGTVQPSDDFTPKHWSDSVTDNDRAKVARVYN